MRATPQPGPRSAGASGSQWWWVAALAAAVVVFVLGYFGIQISARTGTLIGVFEIGVFTVLAIWLIVSPS